MSIYHFNYMFKISEIFSEFFDNYIPDKYIQKRIYMNKITRKQITFKIDKEYCVCCLFSLIMLYNALTF